MRQIKPRNLSFLIHVITSVIMTFPELDPVPVLHQPPLSLGGQGLRAGYYLSWPHGITFNSSYVHEVMFLSTQVWDMLISLAGADPWWQSDCQCLHKSIITQTLYTWDNHNWALDWQKRHYSQTVFIRPSLCIIKLVVAHCRVQNLHAVSSQHIVPKAISEHSQQSHAM